MGDIADWTNDCLQEAYPEWMPVGDPYRRSKRLPNYHGPEFMSRPTRCRNCGSEDVRWRQQGGKWVLFSFTPGVVHACAPNEAAFPIVHED